MKIAIQLLILATALLLGTIASAEEFEGRGALTAKDSAGSELAIDGVVYRVSADTAFRDVDGNPIRFVDLEIPTGDGGLIPVEEIPTVRFRAIETQKGRELISVELLRTTE